MPIVEKAGRSDLNTRPHARYGRRVGRYDCSLPGIHPGSDPVRSRGVVPVLAHGSNDFLPPRPTLANA